MRQELSEADLIERCAKAAEKAWPRAHTYASENADLYRAQDHAVRTVVKAIRALAISRPHPQLRRNDMATDGPNPPECDQEVYRTGECVLVTHSVSPNRLEGWVREVAAKSGQRVDWHFMGGRAVIKALGDISKVHAAIEELTPRLEHLRQRTAEAARSPQEGAVPRE